MIKFSHLSSDTAQCRTKTEEFAGRIARAFKLNDTDCMLAAYYAGKLFEEFCLGTAIILESSFQPAVTTETGSL